MDDQRQLDIFQTILSMAWDECHTHIIHVEECLDDLDPQEDGFMHETREEQLEYLEDVRDQIESMEASELASFYQDQ